VQLQQDVRDLQREVLQQTRRIETLEQQLAQTRTGAGSRLLVPAGPKSLDASPLWLTIANWDRLRTGATELDVIAALGPPTAVRRSEDGTRQTLLYSLEIAAGGFLSGQVVLSDHRVLEVQKPALK